MKSCEKNFRGSAKKLYWYLKRSGSSIALAAGLMGSTVLPAHVNAQAQNPAAAAVTDPQILALLQALAKGQGTGTAALTAAQLRLLAPYLQGQTQLAGSVPAVNPAQLPMLTQMLASQGQTAANEATQISGQSAAAATSAPKKPGTIRIGVVQPQAQMGQGNSGMNVAEPLRATIIQYMSGPAFDVVPIAAMLPVQIEAEVKQKECDYVMYSSISQKTSSNMGMFKKAMPMASMIPMVGMAGGVAGMVASSAAGVAMSSAAGIAGGVKAKSEVSFEYKLMALGNTTPVLANASKAKAKQDGEDVITPLIAQADSAILAELSKKK
jgi:hypothetical protein